MASLHGVNYPMPECAVCLPGLICIPSWDCPKRPAPKRVRMPAPVVDKNARYYQENRQRLLEAARLYYQDDTVKEQKKENRRLNEFATQR